MTTVPDPANPFSIASGGGTPTAGSYGTVMLTALVRLHHALQAVRLPLDMPGVDEQRTGLKEMVDQLEDYVIPRVTTLEAPLLAVVGGSTGAGKSTLVNTLVGHKVTQPGLLRPTTRSPVLVHNPDDALWFGADRLLPDLERVNHPTTDPAALQLVAADAVPPGLAILDAPDVDSVVEENRQLAAELLAAADLWLFVTSAARYADQVPWEFLRQAAERSTAVAIVLDRTPEDAVQTVATHLARMLASRGLKDSPLFVVHEGPVSNDGAAAAGVRRRDPGLAGVPRRRRRGPSAGGHPDARRGGAHPDPAYVPGRRRRRRAGGGGRPAAPGRGRGVRSGRRPGAGRHGGRHPPARRGAGPVAGVHRHRRAAARAREPGGPDPRPGGERRQGEAAAGRTGHGRHGVRPRDADPRARGGRSRARRGVVAAAGVRPGPPQGQRHRPRPGLARAAPQRRARGARLAGGRADDGPDPGPGQADDRAVPRLRRQRPRGRPDDRGLLLHLRAHRRRGRHRGRLGGARPEARSKPSSATRPSAAWRNGPGSRWRPGCASSSAPSRPATPTLLDGLALDPETPEQLRRASRRVEDARYAGQRGS